jgi:hypothetical protein
MNKCMKEHSWIKTGELTGWVWIGPSATMQLYRWPEGVQQLLMLCPKRKPCETVSFVLEPTARIAWQYQAWPTEASRRLDVFIVGDQDTCEGVRKRDEAKSIPVTTACEGPRYFKPVAQEVSK